MERTAIIQLKNWKNKANRKPLILQGARQVGKTYLVNQFGKSEYKNFFHLNFEQEPQLIKLFENSLNPNNIITSISLFLGKKITSKNTLLFFDEIQAAPRAITSLKYFQEQAPEFHIIAAGSLLGVSVGTEQSFPVGKVNFLTLHPLSFNEFLKANEEDLILEHLNNLTSIEPLPDIIHEKLNLHLKTYLYLGGMPEVVDNFFTNKDISEVRKIQKDILNAYLRDFSKYANKSQAIKTSDFWNSIPRQLAKENKKFKYSDISKNARTYIYEQTIEWLKKAGLINLTYNTETPKTPISAYADYSKFKVYMHDVGLLAARLNITSEQIVLPDALFREFNGAFIENFVAQELVCAGTEELFYWTSRSDAEVDFLLNNENKIIPLEVKSGTSKNMKSMNSYATKYNPSIKIRISPRNLRQSGNFINIPLYAIGFLKNFINISKQ